MVGELCEEHAPPAVEVQRLDGNAAAKRDVRMLLQESDVCPDQAAVQAACQLYAFRRVDVMRTAGIVLGKSIGPAFEKGFPVEHRGWAVCRDNRLKGQSQTACCKLAEQKRGELHIRAQGPKLLVFPVEFQGVEHTAH